MARFTTRARPLRVLVALAIVLVTLSVSGTAGATADEEARLFEVTNASRRDNGLAPLAYDELLSNVARHWAQELARSGQLRHNPNLVAEVDAAVTRDWTRLGENVGYSANVDQVQAAYMNSPGHRDNILGDYNRVGVAAVRASDGRLWTTVVFMKGPAISSVSPRTFAPFPNATAFATQQFADLLSRQADAAGLMQWTSALQRGAVSPAGMTAAFVDSAESASLVDPVNRLYRAYFRRPPDAGGVQHWVGVLRGGAPLRELSAAFAGSREFDSTYGALRDDEFVDLVYRNVLGRAADPGGKAYWLALLTAHRVDRGGVMLNFSESSEFKAGTNAWNRIVEVYVGLLRRPPEAAVLDSWIPQLRNGRPLGDLVGTILGSPEYQSRF